MLDPSVLTNALKTVAAQISAAGLPGAAQLAGVIDQLADAVASGTSSLDPSQLTSLFTQLAGAGFDPTAIETAIQDAVAKFSSFDFTSLANNPAGLVDLLLGTLADGLQTAGVPTLPGVIGSVNSTLGSLVSALTGGNTAQLTSVLEGLIGGGLPTGGLGGLLG